MKQHKWHKEIKHLADGGEIEYRTKLGKGIWSDWSVWDEDYFPEFNNDISDEEYRIKPQPKTPKQAWDEELTRSYKETIIERLRNDDKFYDEVFSAYDNAKDNEIKPQPIPSYKGDQTPTGIRKPKYMYVYLDDNYEFSTIPLTGEWEYIGKIKLETEDESH
jgi:hypothetical protein